MKKKVKFHFESLKALKAFDESVYQVYDFDRRWRPWSAPVIIRESSSSYAIEYYVRKNVDELKKRRSIFTVIEPLLNTLV